MTVTRQYNMEENSRKIVPLGTYYNNKTGMMSLSLFMTSTDNFTNNVKLSILVSISPAKREMKNTRPGTIGVYDYDSKISFMLNESEIADFIYHLLRNFTNEKGWEYHFAPHSGGADKSKITTLMIKKDPSYSTVMWTIYSNKKNKEGNTVSCAVSKTDMAGLLYNFKSVAENLSVLKFHALNR